MVEIIVIIIIITINPFLLPSLPLVQTNRYFICMQGMLAIVAGPLLLYFTWTTFVRAPHRHVVGIIATSLIVYTQTLYFSVALIPDASNGSNYFNRNAPSLPVMLLWDIVVEILLPSLVLRLEIIATIKATARADTQQVYPHTRPITPLSHTPLRTDYHTLFSHSITHLSLIFHPHPTAYPIHASYHRHHILTQLYLHLSLYSHHSYS